MKGTRLPRQPEDMLRCCARGADIGVMLHPDYQYAPRLVTAMASMIASDEYVFMAVITARLANVTLHSRVEIEGVVESSSGDLLGAPPPWRTAINQPQECRSFCSTWGQPLVAGW